MIGDTVVFSSLATRQIEALYDYIAREASHEVAANYVAAITATCRKLELFPKRGTPRDDLATGARSISHKGRCTVVYTTDGADVIISGIFYGGQDIAAFLGRA